VAEPVVMKFDVDDRGQVKVEKITRSLDHFDRSMGRAEKTGGKLGHALDGLARKALYAAAAFTGAAAAFVTVHLKKSAEEYKAYETNLADLVKVTDESVDAISKRILGMDVLLGKPTELASAYYQTLSAGVTETNAAMETLTIAAQTAKAAHTDQAIVIEGLTKMMSGYAHESMTAARAADLLFAIEAKGVTTVQKMIPYMGSLSAASKGLGISSQEMAASFATITKLAGDTSEAATRYIALTTTLQRSQGDLSEAIKELGYESGQASEMIAEKGLQGTLRGLFDLIDKGKYRLAQLFPEIGAMQGASFLANQDFKVMAQTMEEMGNIAELQEKAFAAWADTTAAKTEQVQNRISRLRTIIGQNLDPTVKRWLTTLDEWLQKNERVIIQLSDYEYMSLMADGALERLRHDLAQVWIWVKYDAKATWNEVAGIIMGAVENIGIDINYVGSLAGSVFAKMVHVGAQAIVKVGNLLIDGFNLQRDVILGIVKGAEAAFEVLLNQIEVRATQVYNLVASITPFLEEKEVPAQITFKGAYDSSSLGKMMDNFLPGKIEHLNEPQEQQGLVDRWAEIINEREAALAALDETQKKWASVEVDFQREVGDQIMAEEMARHEAKMAMIDEEIQKRQEKLDAVVSMNEAEAESNEAAANAEKEVHEDTAAKKMESYDAVGASLQTAQMVAEATGKKGSQMARALAAATTLYSAYESAQNTYARITEAPGAGPGAVVTANVMAALALAQGLARVAMINSAQTYHTGGEVTPLGPREVPIIAEVGEVILSRQQVAAFAGAGGGYARSQPVNIALFDDRESLNEWAESREGRLSIVRASRGQSQGVRHADNRR